MESRLEIGGLQGDEAQSARDEIHASWERLQRERDDDGGHLPTPRTIERQIVAVQEGITEAWEDLAHPLTEGQHILVDSEKMRISLSLYEALKNAFFHGSFYDPEERVAVRCRIEEEETEEHRRLTLDVIIRDRGWGFRPEKVPEPSMNAVTGRGNMIMEEFMNVRRNTKGNLLHLRKIIELKKEVLQEVSAQ